ncbi:hypothetical protein VTN31DRAFT_2899 [Thermomyces dupontii]|uniref:uncharacterized protein n=1 Tax=Talaromyces thermophilus TaxID=28565 RepID=UPI00374233CE
MSSHTTPAQIQQRVWEGRIPLEIVLDPSECRTYDQSDPYLISYPRISYLPFLLPRLHAFFSSYLIHPDCEPQSGWFSFEGVPLKWHYPLGLLYDLYAGADPASTSSSSDVHQSQSISLAGRNLSQPEDDDEDSSTGKEPLPWRLTLHFTNWPDEDLVRLDAEGLVMHDAFINSVKEADSLRVRDAKGIMSLSKEDSAGLWKAIQNHDLQSFQRISSLLLPPPHQPFRNVPVRVFLPLSPETGKLSLRVLQSPIPPSISNNQTSSRSSIASGPQQPQTVGTALHSLLPNLFPSKRTPVLAKPVLHGSVLPMSAPIEEVARCAAYGDGWLSIVVRMVG